MKMGRFEGNCVSSRKLEWGEIIFSDKYHITVVTPTITAVFHRYGAPIGNYSSSWKRFRQELLRRDLKTLYDVYKYANRFEITHFVYGARLAPKKKDSNEKGEICQKENAK